jgi:CxxC-x17-CxxC domain-containing protein
MEFADKELKCATCGKAFVFSADEQQLFYLKGFVYPPKHCKKCKGTIYGRFETQVRCSECFKETSVPFKPSGKKPILCIDCGLPDLLCQRDC